VRLRASWYPDQWNKAIRATIEATTTLLSPADRHRFGELAVFAEDETIPATLVTTLWQASGVLDQMAAMRRYGAAPGSDLHPGHPRACGACDGTSRVPARASGCFSTTLR
jgi:hypothetical protein